MLDADSVKKEFPLTLHYKMFGGAHVPDIVLTSSQVPSVVTFKKGIMATLKETCREQDESIRTSTARKIQLESLIKALMEEESQYGHASVVVVGGD